MSTFKDKALFAAALAGIALFAFKRLAAAEGPLSPEQVRDFAVRFTRAYAPNIDPLTVRAIVAVESGNYQDPIASAGNTNAFRVEAHRNDASVGTMQVLLGTAQWMHDAGYRRFARPAAFSDLYPVDRNFYWGIAFLDFTARWQGGGHDDEYIVRSYNGGIGRFTTATAEYWRRYVIARDLILAWDFENGKVGTR